MSINCFSNTQTIANIERPDKKLRLSITTLFILRSWCKMSVLQQIVEKLSYLKRLPTNVNNLTFEAETKELALLLPDLQKFNIKVFRG